MKPVRAFHFPHARQFGVEPVGLVAEERGDKFALRLGFDPVAPPIGAEPEGEFLMDREAARALGLHLLEITGGWPTPVVERADGRPGDDLRRQARDHRSKVDPGVIGAANLVAGAILAAAAAVIDAMWAIEEVKR